jgi:hypothetical protein
MASSATDGWGRGRRAGATLIVAAALGAALAGTAEPATRPAPKTDVSFLYQTTTRTPGALSGGHARLVYRARDGGQPQAARRVTIIYPKGYEFDHARLPMCRATDDELVANGRDACPKNTQMGAGETEVLTPYSSETAQLDVSTFNAPTNDILLFTYPGTNRTATVRREHDHGRRHWTDSPPTCVPPGQPPDCSPLGEITVKRFEDWNSWSGHMATTSIMRMPRHCPKSGTWFFRARLTFGDGSRITRKSRAPCNRPRG